MSILSVLFLFLSVDFVGITALEASVSYRGGGDCFFVLCHINCMKILTTIIYLFHIKTWNFLYKNPRVFYSIFFIATNTANKPLSDCITSPKTILPFHFSPKPTAEGETKRQQSKQLQFHKINTKKKEHMSHSYYLTPIEPSFQHLSIRLLEQTVKFVCSSLNVTNPKTRKRLKMHPQPNKLSQHYSKFPSTIPHLRE